MDADLKEPLVLVRLSSNDVEQNGKLLRELIHQTIKERSED